jgi:uncharacterized DUF497 family protein
MPHIEVFWTPGPEGNIAHLAEHNVSPEEAEQVLRQPIATDTSRTTGRPIAFGFTDAGRKLAVVYEKLDRTTLYPITAYEVE